MKEFTKVEVCMDKSNKRLDELINTYIYRYDYDPDEVLSWLEENIGFVKVVGGVKKNNNTLFEAEKTIFLEKNKNKDYTSKLSDEELNDIENLIEIERIKRMSM